VGGARNTNDRDEGYTKSCKTRRKTPLGRPRNRWKVNMKKALNK